MASEYSVRINRRDGIVEIEAPDKEWIAEQLDRLTVVYGEAPGGTSAPVQPSAPASRSEGPQAKAESGTKPRKASRSSSGRASRKPELEQVLTPDLRAKLEQYIEERRAGGWKSKPGQAAIIATFLMDNVGWEGWIDPDDLYTVYSLMGITDAPSNYRSQLSNARQRNGYFGAWVDGRVQLTHSGERFGRHDSKDS